MPPTPPQPTIALPSPPPLIPDLPPPPAPSLPGSSTNTLALLLPHRSLFAPRILALLRSHYEQYGAIAHWAPVRALGRVIVVWEEVEGAQEAKREGDWVRLDVQLDEEGRIVEPELERQGAATAVAGVEEAGTTAGGPSGGHSRKASTDSYFSKTTPSSSHG